MNNWKTGHDSKQWGFLKNDEQVSDDLVNDNLENYDLELRPRKRSDDLENNDLFIFAFSLTLYVLNRCMRSHHGNTCVTFASYVVSIARNVTQVNGQGTLQVHGLISVFEPLSSAEAPMQA